MKRIVLCVLCTCTMLTLCAQPRVVLSTWALASDFAYVAHNDDAWWRPSVFIAHGGGECRDFAMFVVCVLAAQGVDATCVVVRESNGTLHALVETSGVLFDPQVWKAFREPSSVDIVERLDFAALQRLGGFANFGYPN